MQSTNLTAALNGGAAPESDSSTTNNRHHTLSPTPPYQIDEIVLAFHGNHHYDAKVRKVEFRGNRWEYFVHYCGWKKSWDEWLGEDRLMKHTEENCTKKVASNNAQGTDTSPLPVGNVSRVKPKSPAVVKGRKRKSESLTEEKGAVPSEKLVNIQIPAMLKRQLVDDCEFITHFGKLVKLPRDPNVEDILQKYSDMLNKDGLCMMADTVREFTKGLLDYFEKALPAMLLYRNERQQYADVIRRNAPASKIYGAEHLLRLFVKLPELLASANFEEETLILLQHQFVDFLKFLHKNQSAFFLPAYLVKEDSEMSSNKQDD